jgi:UPF0716 family protein affecting phage T7 exclusion
MCGLSGFWKVLENGTVNTLVLLNMPKQQISGTEAIADYILAHKIIVAASVLVMTPGIWWKEICN